MHRSEPIPVVVPRLICYPRPFFYTNIYIYIDSERSDVFLSSVTVIVVRRPLLVHLEEVK